LLTVLHNLQLSLPLEKAIPNFTYIILDKHILSTIKSFYRVLDRSTMLCNFYILCHIGMKMGTGEWYTSQCYLYIKLCIWWFQNIQCNLS
jgi:hypothetical protein